MQMINNLIDFLIKKDKLMIEESNISRNCGKWIGYITLVCNRPILQKDFSIKQKIILSLQNNKLNNIIPVICSILLLIEKSSFFDIKVPFINALLDILREIVSISWVSNSTKVYIEVLFNQLEIKQKEIHTFNYLQKQK